MRFLQSIRPEIIQQQPHLKHHEIIKLIALKWSSYDIKKKEMLQEQYKQDMQAYSYCFKKYKQSISPEQLILIQKAKEKQKHSKDLARINEVPYIYFVMHTLYYFFCY